MFSITNSYAALDLESLQDDALRACASKAVQKASITDSSQLTELKCHNKKVVSLTGIEQFSKLKRLSLFGNNIKHADLRGLASLEYLNLAKNKLSTLRIEGLNKLHTLYVFKNQLRTINFEGLTNLSKMRLMQNNLEKLDILPLQSLAEAYLWDNKLEDLQISGLKNLTFLDVKQNPMPDALYDFYDEQIGITISHDGNADDWK